MVWIKLSGTYSKFDLYRKLWGNLTENIGINLSTYKSHKVTNGIKLLLLTTVMSIIIDYLPYKLSCIKTSAVSEFEKVRHVCLFVNPVGHR